MRNEPRLDPKHQEFLTVRFEAWAAEQPDAKKLRARLLELAGLEIVAPPNNFEPDMDALLKQGRLIEGPRRLELMEDNACHWNAAMLCRNAKSPSVGVGTGWALHRGLWRQHSWAMDSKIVVETTSEQEAYFGILLFERDAEAFCALIGD